MCSNSEMAGRRTKIYSVSMTRMLLRSVYLVTSLTHVEGEGVSLVVEALPES